MSRSISEPMSAGPQDGNGLKLSFKSVSSPSTDSPVTSRHGTPIVSGRGVVEGVSSTDAEPGSAGGAASWVGCLYESSEPIDWSSAFPYARTAAGARHRAQIWLIVHVFLLVMYLVLIRLLELHAIAVVLAICLGRTLVVLPLSLARTAILRAAWLAIGFWKRVQSWSLTFEAKDAQALLFALLPGAQTFSSMCYLLCWSCFWFTLFPCLCLLSVAVSASLLQRRRDPQAWARVQERNRASRGRISANLVAFSSGMRRGLLACILLFLGWGFLHGLLQVAYTRCTRLGPRVYRAVRNAGDRTLAVGRHMRLALTLLAETTCRLVELEISLHHLLCIDALHLAVWGRRWASVALAAALEKAETCGAKVVEKAEERLAAALECVSERGRAALQTIAERGAVCWEGMEWAGGIFFDACKRAAEKASEGAEQAVKSATQVGRAVWEQLTAAAERVTWDNFGAVAHVFADNVEAGIFATERASRAAADAAFGRIEVAVTSAVGVLLEAGNFITGGLGL